MRKRICGAGSALALACASACAPAFCLLWSCSPGSEELFLPAGDIRPPSIVEAGQREPDVFEIHFDEEIAPLEGSFSFVPESTKITPRAEGAVLRVALDPAAGAGSPCSLSGEAADSSGNTTRFLFTFVGFNAHPASLRLNELQPGKNSSASDPHRDYMEFVVESGGNLGGIQAQWASSAKLMSYTFPPCEVRTGEVVVLHCAPEDDPAEIDETGASLSASGGVDANSSGRDFWTAAGGIPDESGVVALRAREADPPSDGLFYASVSKSGQMDAPKVTGILAELGEAGVWPCSAPPLWEEAFLWRSSPSRPLHRARDGESGPAQWSVGESGSQSPGLASPAEPKAGRAKAGKKVRKTD